MFKHTVHVVQQQGFKVLITPLNLEVMCIISVKPLPSASKHIMQYKEQTVNCIWGGNRCSLELYVTRI